MRRVRQLRIGAVLIVFMALSAGVGRSQQYKMETPLPPGISIPDKVDSRLGTLRFQNGFPDKDTTERLFDNLDFQRAVQAYLLALPVVSQTRGFQVNADGSADVYFGPKAPTGKENKWIQTLPGRGWNTLLRLYGPLQPWFDKTWRPGEIEPM